MKKTRGIRLFVLCGALLIVGAAIYQITYKIGYNEGENIIPAKEETGVEENTTPEGKKIDTTVDPRIDMTPEGHVLNLETYKPKGYTRNRTSGSPLLRKDRILSKYEEQISRSEEDEFMQGDMQVDMSEVPPMFVLRVIEDYVFVFMQDGITLYESTGIEVSTLSESLQRELHIGKPVYSLEELYSFLENYSS